MANWNIRIIKDVVYNYFSKEEAKRDKERRLGLKRLASAFTRGS
jgi:hypothetical protein